MGAIAVKTATILLCMFALLAPSAWAAKPAEVRAAAGVDFSQYATYAWAPHDFIEDDHPLRDGSMLDMKIKNTADGLLKGKGYQLLDKDAEHDLLINYVGYGEDVFESEGTTAEIASGVKWIGDVNAHSMRSYREGTLVFEVIDRESGEMVWSGWVTEAAPSIDKLRNKAEKATRSVFKHFPDK